MSSQEVQENGDDIFGYTPADPAVGPPQYFPGPEALPSLAPLPNVPPADSLRNLASRYINSPGTHIDMLRGTYTTVFELGMYSGNVTLLQVVVPISYIRHEFLYCVGRLYAPMDK